MADFKIRSSGKECMDCRKRFQVGEAFYSLLKFEAQDGPVREDRCVSCWKSKPPSSDYVWWLTRRRKPRNEKPKIDVESVKALFWKLLEKEKEEFAGLRYVTALLLIRKKKLRLVGFRRCGDGEYLELKPPGRNKNGVFKVYVPVLSNEDLEDLKEKLKQSLTIDP